MYKVIYYVSRRGENFVRDFIFSLPEKAGSKVAEHIKYLSVMGPLAKPQYVSMLRDKIYELRVTFAHYEPRVLYFFNSGCIVLTHGFLKKTRAVPQEEIERAKHIRLDFLSGQ